MAVSEIATKVATTADPEGQTVFAMVEAIRGAIVPFADPVEPHHSMALAMTAAASFAGIQIGHLIALGVVSDQDKKRMVDMMARNVRNGIDIGKKNAFRAAENHAGGTGRA